MPEIELTTTQPRPTDVAPLDISVVVPVRNEAAHIEGVLAGLLGQDLGTLRMEILVVDGESDDDTVACVERVRTEDDRVRVLANPRRLSSAARALGVEASRGRFVAIVDGHCHIPSKTLLKDMVTLFDRTGADCLARPQPLVTGEESWMARAIAAARTSPFGHSTRSTIYDDGEHKVDPTSAGAMYRRRVFDRVGNFDPAFDACEDVEFNYRCAQADLQCWTSPKLAIEYEPRRTLKALWKQLHRYGLGRARLHRKHRSAFSFESLIPAGFVAGIPLALLGLLLPTPWRFVLPAFYALYAVLNFLFSYRTASKQGRLGLFPALLLVFPTIHGALGVGYLKGWCTRPPRFDAESA